MQQENTAPTPFTPDLKTDLSVEAEWFGVTLNARLEAHAEGNGDSARPAPPDTAYGAACRAAGLDNDERLIATLSLIPWIAPTLLDLLTIKNQMLDRPFTEFGGWFRPGHGGLLPTRETAIFVVGADAIDTRLAMLARFGPDAPLQRQRILIAHEDRYAPWLPVEPHPDWLARMLG